MKEFAALVKAQLITRYTGKSGKMKKWVIYLILLLSFSPILASVGYSMYLMGFYAAEEQVLSGAFSAALTAIQVVIMFMGLFSLLGVVYFSTDNEMLLGLPLSPRTVFLSKLFVVYLDELIICILLSLSMLVPLGAGAGAGAGYFFFLIFVTLAAPMLPLLVAAILSVPLMYTVTFFKRRGAAGSIAAISIFTIIFTLYMIVSGSFASSENTALDDLALLIRQAVRSLAAFGDVVYPNLVLGKAAFADSFHTFALNILIALGILAALLTISALISSMCYTSSRAMLETSKLKNGSEIRLREDNNITRTLIRKDFVTLIRNPGVAFQCSVQLILLPVMTGFFAVSLRGVMDEAIMDSKILILIFILVQMFFVLSMNVIASTSITRENRNFFFMKTMPISYETQIMAKVYFADIVNAAALLITNTIAIFVFAQNLLDILHIILGMCLLFMLGHGFGMKSAALDLKRPRLNWQTVTEGLKNNSAILVGMLYSVLVFMAAFVIGLLFYSMYYLTNSELIFFVMWAVLIALAFVIMVLCRNSLMRNLEQKFDAIES